MKRLLAIVCAVLVSGSVRAEEKAEPPIHFTTPVQVVSPSGAKLDLPPGYFTTETTWQAIDLEMKRLQGKETRNDAENASLRSSVSSNSALSAKVIVTVIAITAAAAFAGGVYAGFQIRGAVTR